MAYLKSLWLLATCCCSILNSLAAVSVPITRAAANINNSAAINLPNGFDSQASPMNPLLYPFATAQLPASAAWQPMAGINATLSHMPHSLEYPAVLQDRISTAPTVPPLSAPAEAAQAAEADNVAGPVLESIVYGTWKPEQTPVQPEQIFDMASLDSAAENVSIDRIDDRLMAILSGQHDLTEQYNFPESRQSMAASSTERKDDRVYDEIPIAKKYGRKKIPTRQENLNRSEIKTGVAVISVNISDPHLLAMAKQINHSAEIITAANAGLPAQTTQSTWTPMASTTAAPTTESGSDERTEIAMAQSTTAVPKNWPTGFEQTTMTTASTPPLAHSNYNIKSDSTDGPPQALSGGFNIPESLLPQMPFNITKMGVPYEHQNSSEEPSICVPLTVREESLVNTPGSPPEIVNVERVYCFPLPPAEERNMMEYGSDNGSDNGTTLTLDSEEAKVNVLSDFEEGAPLLPSAAPNIGRIDGGLLALVCLAVLKYHHPT